MLSDMVCAGAFHNNHNTVGGIPASTATSAQADADCKRAIDAAAITNRTQMTVPVVFVWCSCIVSES